MRKSRSQKGADQADRVKRPRPAEIDMTDLEAGLDAREDDVGTAERQGGMSSFAAGTPGGGSSVGGLGGTNVGDGAPVNADIDDALAGVVDDNDAAAEEEPLEDRIAYSGHAGGAVGGTPAEGRASGGQIHGGLAPGGTHRGDSTVGADDDQTPQ